MNTKEFKLMEARFSTRFYCVAFMFPLLLVLFGCLIQPQEGGQAKVLSGWSKAKEAFDRLGRTPPSLAAREFYYSISYGIEIYCDIPEMLGHIFGHYQGVFSNRQHKIIAIEILNWSIFTTSSAVRMVTFVNSGWQKPHDDSRRQEVRECLVELITVNPSLFLRVCYEEREDSYQKEKGFPVGIISSIMNKKKTRALYELEMKRENLRLVENPDLRRVSDERLKALDISKKRIEYPRF